MFKGFHQVGNYGLTRKVTNAFGGYPSNSFETGVGNYAQLSNLVAWWNNGEGITTATGVSSWVDRIGGYNLSQATAANQPSYTQQNQSYNGKASISFAAGQTLSAGDVLDIRTNTGWTLCIFAIVPTANTNRLFIGKTATLNSSFTSIGEYGIVNDVSNCYGRIFDASATTKTTGAIPLNTTIPAMWALTLNFQTGVMGLSQNGSTPITTSISTTATDYDCTGPFTMNQPSIITQTAFEILVYSTALSQSELLQNTIAMKTKFGVI